MTSVERQQSVEIIGIAGNGAQTATPQGEDK